MFCSMNVKVVLSVGPIPPVLCLVTHLLPRISTWRLIIDVIIETKANYRYIRYYNIYIYYTTKDIVVAEAANNKSNSIK
jgi:hypothetical protein